MVYSARGGLSSLILSVFGFGARPIFWVTPLVERLGSTNLHNTFRFPTSRCGTWSTVCIGTRMR